MRLSRSLLVSAAVVPLVRAYVQFTKPTAGDRIEGGKLSVEWKDSGSTPSIADLQTYQLLICAGSNTNQAPTCTSLRDRGVFSDGNTASVEVPLDLGASTPENAYYIKVMSIAADGRVVVNYSDRFTLLGMTGTFPAAFLTDLNSVADVNGPWIRDRVARQVAPVVPPVAPVVPPVAPVVPPAGAAPAAGAAPPAGAVPPAAGAGDANFKLPYTMQTGNIRYAPMQPQPPTKITAKDASRLHPTSSFVIATTYLKPPIVVTTVTQAPTYKVTSRENSASPAPNPKDDMQKFLNRWKD